MVPLEGRRRDFRTGSAWFAMSVGQPRRRAVQSPDDRGSRPGVGASRRLAAGMSDSYADEAFRRAKRVETVGTNVGTNEKGIER
jgi:hypothetical protein